MAYGVTGINNINSLLTQTFGMGGFGSGMSGINALSSMNALTGIQQMQQSLTNAIQDQQSFNRTELSLYESAGRLNDSALESGAVSSDPDAVGVTASANATAGTYEIEVGQLAQGQQVTGDQLDAAAASGITTAGGWAQVQIDVNGQSSLVSFQLTGNETNEEAMGKMAAAINNSSTGINAAVDVDAGGIATLNLEGETGAGNEFTVTDTVGNAAAYTGADNPANVTQNAQNAEFSINGIDFETATNDVELVNAGLTLNLQQTTGGAPVDVTVEATGGEDFEDNVGNFISQYNETINSLRNSDSASAQRSLRNLQTITGSRAGQLRDIGIDVGAGGELRVSSQGRFEQAMADNPGAVRAALTGPGGLAPAVQAESERAINQSLDNSITGGFTNYAGPGGFNYGASVNSMIAGNIGMFFNSLF